MLEIPSPTKEPAFIPIHFHSNHNDPDKNNNYVFIKEQHFSISVGFPSKLHVRNSFIEFYIDSMIDTIIVYVNRLN